MNRTDRLLAIILELQDRKNLRAEDLAAIFEVSLAAPSKICASVWRTANDERGIV
jgi:hypothetical protein